MRVLHFADVHLGYRAYNRVTEQGINQREADVFKTFEFALEAMVGVTAGPCAYGWRPVPRCAPKQFGHPPRFPQTAEIRGEG
jgi:hypothetical protein